MEVQDVKYQIKKWEHEFRKHNNRVPSKQDIKLHPEIRNLYKSYQNSKGSSIKNPPTESVESTVKATIDSKDLVDIQISEILTDVEDHVESGLDTTTTKQAELGPTPQANGKVLSIFDFRLTPPESSPLKGKVSRHLPPPSNDIFSHLPPPASNDIFKTPTKTTRVKDIQIHSEMKGISLTSKFQSLSNKPETPTKNVPIFTGLETPQYLGKNNKKFDFNIPPNTEISSSPISMASPSKPFSGVFVTPTKSSIPTFLISPSPLKPHRFLNKKLSDVFNDFKIIQEENSTNSGEQNVFEDAQESETEGDENTVKRRKKFTQKRTTRRFKMKPRLAEETSDKLVRKNVHKEIAKLTKAQFEEIDAAMKTEEILSEEPESDSDQEYVKQDPNETKGMVKRSYNNFQRLKINDPRSKAFKRRMRR